MIGSNTAQSAHFVTGTAMTYDPDSSTSSCTDVPYRFNQLAYAPVDMSAEYKLSDSSG